MSAADKVVNKRRVAIYGRVSTEHEAQVSAFENQVAWYDVQVGLHKDWEVKQEHRYFDKGLSGTQAKKRHSFMRLIEDAKKKQFDLVITREVSRFARNTYDALKYTRMLKSLGIEVIFIVDNISTFDKDGEVRLTNMAAHAQDESRKLSERVKEGQKIARHVKKELYGSGNILGYNRSGKTFVIDEEQAETVRMIYKLYLEGMGIRTIRNELLKAKRKNASGIVKWDDSNISRILENMTYTGRQRQMQTTVTDFLEHTKKVNAKDDHAIIQGDYEPIISIEDFNRVSDIKASRLTKYAGNKTRGNKVSNDKWMNLLECNCGSKFQQFKWRKDEETGEPIKGYTCRNRRLNGDTEYRLQNELPLDGVCDMKTVSQWYLELMIKDILEDMWGYRKEAVIKAFEIIKDSFSDEGVDNSKKVQELASRIEKNKQKIGRLTDLYADNIIEKSELATKISDCNAIIKEASKEIELLSGGLELVEKNFETKLNRINEVLNEMIDFDCERLEESIINQLVDKVVVRNDRDFEWLLNLSDVETDDIFGFNLNEKYEVKREKTIGIRDTKYTFVFNSAVSIERATEYRKKYGKHIKYNRWNDINFSVYVR